MQDVVGALVVVGVLWLVVKLAFGGPSSNASGPGSGSHGGRSSVGGVGVSKESAAAQAWRESRDERQRQLKRRKEEMIETARRKMLEQEAKKTFTRSEQTSTSASVLS